MAEPIERRCVCSGGLALAAGIVWGLGLFIVGIISIHTPNYGHEFARVLGSVYVGYAPGTWAGAWLGLAWGFGDGFVAGLLVGWLYNLFCCWGRKPAPPKAP